MRKLIDERDLPGFIGLIHREEGDEVLPRFTRETTRTLASAELRRGLEEEETLRAVLPLALAVQLGIETAAAFEPHSQFQLEDMIYALDKNQMADLATVGVKLKDWLGSGEQTAETGPFKLKGLMTAFGRDVIYHGNQVKDAEMIAELFEEVSNADLIEVPTANGEEINLRVAIDKGFGHYRGQDTCVIRMYSPEWEYLASDVMPVEADFFGLAISRAGSESGTKLAKEIVLLALEYAFTIYGHLNPHLNDAERTAAEIKEAGDTNG